MEALIQLVIFLVMLVTGYVFGRWNERSHYKSIFAREDSLRDIVVSTERIPEADFMQHDVNLVSGSVVVSVDFFKVVAAGLRSLIGGRLRAFETLLDRARREALLRMQQEAKALGATLIINTKFETSQISGQAGKGIGSVEVLVYGTALIARG